MALLNEVFDDLSLFYENDSTVIFQGVRREDSKKVFLKSHKNKDEMFRIKHEFDLLSDKNIQGAIKVLDVSYNDDKNYLVFENTDTVVLDNYIAEHDFDAKTFLKIGQSAAEALATIHKHGIVHCDIKPANMLIHPETLEIQYIDFGISFSQHGQNSRMEGFAGTLEYMAPEQTGRLNMTVDTRSDLYSLGITFFQMLTKKLPFTGESAVEIIHAHTVMPPPPVTEYVDADPTISTIIHKLMEKSPRKRYQSAESLAYDLGLCRARLDKAGRVEAFTLGEKDVFFNLESGQKLYGKESLLDDLKGIFQSSTKKSSNLVLVHGPVDSGKSNLLDSFEEYVGQNHGYIAKGGFDWKEDQKPYAAIQEAFEGFELYAYNVNLPLPAYRTKILEALGENSQVLIDIIPAFGPLLGEQRPVKKLNALQTKERARQVFKKAFQIICDAPFPYVFIFENMQWADEGSLDLLLSAVEDRDVGNCIMILSYRDDDVAFLQGFQPRVQGMDRRKLTVTDMAVPYLKRDDVAYIVGDLFEQDEKQSQELADIIQNATGGVLPKVRAFLQSMYRSEQIVYDADSDSWHVRMDNLDQDLLVDLENRYKAAFDEFEQAERDLLSRLSCFGESFSYQDIALVFGAEFAELDALLDQLKEKSWLTSDSKRTEVYSFPHQTIYNLCYHALEQKQCSGIHKQIVDRLYEAYKDDQQQMLGHITLFTRQVLFSDRTLFDKATIRGIAACKLLAAQQIMEAGNAAQAAHAFGNGIRLLGSDPFATDYKLAYQLHLDFAMCRFALHEDDKATELLEIVLEHASNENDFYSACHRAVTHYLSTADWENAKIYCKRYLKMSGLLLPEDADPREAGDKEYEHYVEMAGAENDGISVALQYKFTDDPLVEHQGNMLAMLADALLFNMDEKCKYYLYKAINYALDRKCMYTEFSRNFCVGAARYASVREFDRAMQVIEVGLAYADKNGGAQAFMWCIYGNMISHWVNPLAGTAEIYKKAKYHALMEGNAFYEAFADMMLLNYQSFVGENLEEYHRTTQATLHNLQRNKLEAMQANFTTFRQYARCLLGRTVSPDSFDDAQYKEADLEGIEGTWNGVFNNNFLFAYRLRALYIHQYYEQALEYAEKYKQQSRHANFSSYITHVQFYYYYSMTLVELCRKYPERQEEYLKIIDNNQKHLGFYAKANPANFEYKHKLVNTAVKALQVQDISLVDEYAAANHAFVAKGLVWDVIFVERLIGDFWKARGIPQYDVVHKKNALRHYKDIGAKHMIGQLAEVDDEKPHKKHGGHTKAGATMVDTKLSRTTMHSTVHSSLHTQYSGINVSLDFQALLHTLELLLEMDTLPALAAELMDEMMRNGNAEKALLFLEDGSVINLVAAKYAVESEGDFNETELPVDINIVEDVVLPKKLLEMAKVKNQTLVANAARNEYRLIGDDYINKHIPESFVCIPVNAKGKHLGVIYMENASLPGSFPDGRVYLLEAVVRQASVLIQNQQNVAIMEIYTKDLERRLSTYLSQQNALIAGIAHEINSPVGVCLTVSTKMFEKTKQIIEAINSKALSKSALAKYLEESREGLNIINNNVTRAADLVSNFKKMTVEQSNEVFEMLDLSTAIHNIVDYVRPGVKKKVDKIDIDIPAELAIYSSSGVLAQIFTNLIMNSAIHGFENMEKDGCEISLKVTDLENREEIEIVYTDNGKGMSEEEQEKVFQPFFTTKRNRGGSGLGGHIVLTNVTQTLGGSVRCISAPGEGTTFVIRLPKDKRKESKKEVTDNE